MKLLLCIKCGDIFNLHKEIKSCTCGHASGKYLDNINAEYYGGIPLGFDNISLIDAVQHRPMNGLGSVFTAFVIPNNAKTMVLVNKPGAVV